MTLEIEPTEKPEDVEALQNAIDDAIEAGDVEIVHVPGGMTIASTGSGSSSDEEV